ncbi:MAG: hypothetical protein ACYC7D_04635 [Nitrososphaerales archaeon]
MSKRRFIAARAGKKVAEEDSLELLSTGLKELDINPREVLIESLSAEPVKGSWD